MPYARFVQMLRIIAQEEAHQQAWELFLAGNARKEETFAQYARRMKAENRTPEPRDEQSTARIVQGVRERLGVLYRPPITA